MKKKALLAVGLILSISASLFAGCGKSASTESAESQAASAASTVETSAATPEETTEEKEENAAAEATVATTGGKDTITIGIAQDFDSLDPHHMVVAGTKQVLFNMFEGLVKPTSEGEIVPAVASEVEKSEDGLTYTFTLRDGVTFHNGDPVEMEDVLYSIERRRNGEDAAALLEALAIIADMQAEGNTLTITLSEPSNEFLAFLMNAYIIPADYADQETAPVGTGPYKFVSRAVQDELVLERFDEYWGEPAQIQNAVFKILDSADSMVLGLQSGALDLVMNLTADQALQLSEDEFNIENGSMNLVQALYLNNAVAPLDDVRVRQALSYAIDKQAVIDLACDGYGTPLGTSMFPSFGKYYDESLTDYYTQDVAKAKELLAEAGYPDGFDLTITVVSAHTPHVNAATVMVEMLREIGVNATVELVDNSTWMEQVYNGRNYQSTVTGTTSDNMTARKLLERFGSEVSNNFTNYNNAEYDTILAQALAETDDAEQTELYKQLERNLTENAANVYLQDMADVVAVRKGLSGLTFYPIYAIDVSALSWS